MPWPACCAGTTLSVQQRFPREQEQNHQQAERGVFEDRPGDPQPATLAGDQPGQQGGAKRDRDGDRDQADERDQLAELGREARDAGGRVLVALENDAFERPRFGHRGANQLVVDGVAGLVSAESAQ